jgi:hypothetical protein
VNPHRAKAIAARRRGRRFEKIKFGSYAQIIFWLEESGTQQLIEPGGNVRTDV